MKKSHSSTVVRLMEEAGYPAESCERVRKSMLKQDLKKNQETQVSGGGGGCQALQWGGGEGREVRGEGGGGVGGRRRGVGRRRRGGGGGGRVVRREGGGGGIEEGGVGGRRWVRDRVTSRREKQGGPVGGRCKRGGNFLN